MKQQTQNQSYNFLVKKINATRSKESIMLMMSGVLLALACTALAILTVAFVELFAEGDTAFRTFLFATTVAVLLTTTGIFVIPNLLRIIGIKGLPTVNEIALRIGNYYPNVKDKLGNAIQLVANSENAVGSSKTLIEAEAETIYNETKNIDFDVIIAKKNFNKILILFLASMLLMVATLNISSGMNEALFRIQNYSLSFLPPAPFTITLLTNEQTLLRGTKTEIVFAATGQAPDHIQLHIKEDNQQNYDEFRLRRDGENLYKFEIASVKQNVSFYGEATWLTSAIVTNIGKINVIDRPIVRSIAGKLRFPAYTKLAAKDIDDQSADIAALIGSTAEFTITANKKLKNAYIVFEKSMIELSDNDNATVDTFHIPLKLNDSRASGSFRITQNGFYYFVIEDFDGEKNINPIKYSVVALSDGAPSIALLFPTTDVQVSEQAILPIKLIISDDYGFSDLRLHYRMLASKYSPPDADFSSIPISINSNEQVVEIAYVWDLNKIHILPEDIYEFYIEVADNNSTPQKARTQILKVRLPSLEEVSREADVAQTQISRELENVKKEAEQVRRNIDELERELRKKTNEKELGWREKQQIQDILQKQSQLQDKMQQLSEQVQQTTQQLQQNNMLSSETMQKYQDLQKLMQEVRSPQFDKMRDMQRQALLENMSPDELRKAMEEAKFDEESFRASIDRTMEILKRMQAEQKTDALTKRAEALKQKQDALNEELKNTNPNDKNKMNELAKKQEHLQNDLKNISKDLQDLAKLMQEIGEDMPMQQMQEAMDALDNQGISEDMKSASSEMQSGEKSKADKSQKSASQKLDNVAQKMRDMKQEMQSQNSREVMRRLQRAINNLASISKQQEATKNKTQRFDANSTRVPEISEEQADVFENLYNLAMELNEIGSKSFAISPDMANDINDAMRQMPNIMNQLTDRRMSGAARLQTEAMKKMNSALAQMQQSLSEMQGGGSCENGGGSGSCGGSGRGGSQGMGMGGMQQMLQQMAAEQQALNQQMQQMLGQGGAGGTNPGRYSQEQQAGMQRLAGDQDRLRKSLEDLANEQKDLGGKPEDRNDAQKLSNELTKLADELKEITSDISRGRISTETLQRQERILSRLLDATRSVNERDFEKRREERTGTDILQRSPSGIDLSTQEGKTRAMQELMQSISRGYTKDYEQIIRQYFEAIQKNF